MNWVALGTIGEQVGGDAAVAAIRYLALQNQDDSVPKELWVGQDGWMREQLNSSPIPRRFWRNTDLMNRFETM